MFGQGAGDTAGPGCRLGEDLRRKLILLNGEVGHAKPSAGAEHSGAFGHYAGFSRRQVDDAVGNDQIHAGVWERNDLHLAVHSLYVVQAGFLRPPRPPGVVSRPSQATEKARSELSPTAQGSPGTVKAWEGGVGNAAGSGAAQTGLCGLGLLVPERWTVLPMV